MRANLDDDVMSFEQYNELAKKLAEQSARFDDGLDDDFLEEEWQFVPGSDKDDEDEGDDSLPCPRPNYYIDDDDDDTADPADEENDSDWEAGTEEYVDDDDDADDAWYEDDEE